MERRECVTLENEGERIFGILHRPAASNPPLVIVFHGFASNKLGTNRSYLAIAKRLAENGIATFRFDFRGFGDSEGDPSRMTVEQFISDGVTAFTALEKRGFSRIGLFGSSFGGAVAALAAERLKRVRSLALWAPVASGQLWFTDFHEKNQAPQGQSIIYRGVEIPKGFLESFGKMRADSALEALGDVPLLHFQGEEDDTISLAHQKAFVAARGSASAQTHFIVYPATNHTLGHAGVLPAVSEELVTWFQTTL